MDSLVVERKTNVIQLKKRLIGLDIIDEMQQGRIQFLDPMYKHWLVPRYFNIRS